jgi:DNA-binding NarL/FixJ family response regulator
MFLMTSNSLKKMNFLLVDDHPVVRDGIRKFLVEESFVKSVYEAGNKREFMEQITRNIDVVLLDFKLPDTNGLELLREVKACSDEIKVIAITTYNGVPLILNLLKNGVHGIISKEERYTVIRKIILNVLDDGSYFSVDIVEIIRANAHRWHRLPPVTLTTMDLDILKAIAEGLPTKKIAEKLGQLEVTVATYRIRLMKKLDVPNTAALLAYAYSNGIL